MGDELQDLKHNLKVSFSRMKDDIQENKSKIDMLIEINRKLQSKIDKLQEAKPKGLKSELMRHYKKNKKGIIKQRILDFIKEKEYSLPELKEIIVDDKQYCSKASFYRYIDELKNSKWLDTVSVDGNQMVVIVKP